MSTVTSYAYYDTFKETPRRYFNLGVLCCCIAGFVFFIGIILMVFGSSPSIPEYVWIVGIVLLLLGGLLFVMGVTSIGLYYSREDKRKSEMEFISTDAYLSSAASARSVQSNNINNIYLIE